MSVQSPRNLFIFIISKNVTWIKVLNKYAINFKTEVRLAVCTNNYTPLSSDEQAHPVGTLIIESTQARKQVSTGALKAFDDPSAVLPKKIKNR